MYQNLLIVWWLVVIVEVIAKCCLKSISNPLSEERESNDQLRKIKIEMRQHNGPEAFVIRAKLERQSITLEKKINGLKEDRIKSLKQREQMISKIKLIVFGMTILYFWSEPLCYISSWGMWPLSWLFAFPLHPSGSIGVVAGVLVSQQGVSRILSSF